MIFSEICEYLGTRLKVPTEINGFLLSIDAKNRRDLGFRFYCWQHISVHISGHGCDKWIRFSVVRIIYRCAYSQIKIRKIGEKKFSVFTAGSIFRSISRVMGVINEFSLR